MIALWGQIIQPLVEAIDGRRILEIGAEYGLSTKVLLSYVKARGGHLHCIDPVPGFDVTQFIDENKENLAFYEELSLNALPSIPPVDIALVDGDHNWYTVYNELKLIEMVHKSDPMKMPLIFVHDIGWPYARRDLYYNPDNIPDEYRHPYARKGMGRLKRELLETGGLNTEHYNALIEGGERNGVLTAVEDYILESSLKYKFLNLPLYYGLGVLITQERLDSNHKLHVEVEKLQACLREQKLTKIAEKLRLNTLAVLQKRQEELRELEVRTKYLESELHKLESMKSMDK